MPAEAVELREQTRPAHLPEDEIFRRNVAQRGDALELLRWLPADCSTLGFSDPQHRENLDKLKYGNEGSLASVGDSSCRR
jgi:hypothetical protein